MARLNVHQHPIDLQPSVAPDINLDCAHFLNATENCSGSSMQIGLSTQTQSAGRSPDLSSSVRDEHFRNEVGRIGSYPFILISVGHQAGPDGFVLCKTQAEVVGFVGELAATPRFSDSLLIRGIERALQQDIYEAGDLFYRWTKSEGVVDETPHICQPDERLIHTGYNYPMFALDSADPVAGSEARTQILMDVLTTYAGTDGNNAMRFSIMEATALALSRALQEFVRDTKRPWRRWRKGSQSAPLQFS